MVIIENAKVFSRSGARAIFVIFRVTEANFRKNSVQSKKGSVLSKKGSVNRTNLLKFCPYLQICLTSESLEEVCER